MTFTYRAVDTNGKVTTGEMTAPAIDHVATILRKRGLIVLDILPEKTGLIALLEMQIFEKRRLPLKNLLSFTRELATLVNAGLTIVKSLSVLTTMTTNSRMAKIISRLLTDIREGDSFQTALLK